MGLNRYTKISVQYKDQVVGTKKAAVSRIDSLQALKNIRQMIEDAKTLASDTALTAEETAVRAESRKPMVVPEPDSAGSKAKEKRRSLPTVAAPNLQPAAHSAKQHKPETHATKPKAGASGIKPKAIMTKPQSVH